MWYIFHDLVKVRWLGAIMMRSGASMFAQGKARLHRAWAGARHTDWGVATCMQLRALLCGLI